MKHFEKVRDFVVKCKYCQKEIPSGIWNMVNHTTECELFPKAEIEPLTIGKLKEIFLELFHSKES